MVALHRISRFDPFHVYFFLKPNRSGACVMSAVACSINLFAEINRLSLLVEDLQVKNTELRAVMDGDAAAVSGGRRRTDPADAGRSVVRISGMTCK